jgi:hypothetical protein
MTDYNIFLMNINYMLASINFTIWYTNRKQNKTNGYIALLLIILQTIISIIEIVGVK